jgi:hypothetical protein
MQQGLDSFQATVGDTNHYKQRSLQNLAGESPACCALFWRMRNDRNDARRLDQICRGTNRTH